MTTVADYGGRACVRARVRNECAYFSSEAASARMCVCVCARAGTRVCTCACALVRARECVSARARGHDDFGKHGGLYRPMAEHLLASRATAIRDDEERGRETGRRERMTGRDDGSGGERTGFATSNNECLLPPAKPSFSLLQPTDEAPRAVTFQPSVHDRVPIRPVFLSERREEMQRQGVSYTTNKRTGLIPVRFRSRGREMIPLFFTITMRQA